MKLEKDSVWLNREQIAQLYGRDYKTIAKHINNALREELEGEPVVAKFATPKKYGRKEGYTQMHCRHACGFDTNIAESRTEEKVDIFISRDSRLYCQVEFSLSLQEEERDINGTCVEKLKDLLPSCNNICVWKYISPLEFDEVFQLFVDVVNRCKQLVNNG